MNDLEAQLDAILRQILEVSPEDDLSMQNCAAWTSLAHIDLIMSIEESFGVSFGADDLPLLVSKKALQQRLRELLGC